MDVTKSNYDSVYDQIKSLLPTCSFCAIDLEMSGIRLPQRDSQEQLHDLPFLRFEKMRKTATTYNIIQFGICLFHKIENNQTNFNNKEHYIARPYNFYLFPSTLSASGLTNQITMESSAIEFLIRHGMDFNKWLKDGITYCDRKQFDHLKQKLVDENGNGNNNQSTNERQMITLTKESDIQFVQTEIKRLKQWLNNPNSTSVNDTIKEFHFNDCNSFLRRALYEMISNDSQLNHLIVQSTPKPNDLYKHDMIALNLADEEKIQREEQLKKQKILDFEQRTGFTRLFQALSEHQIPLIIHNGFYDMLFTLSSLDYLPLTYAEFKIHLHKLFPVIYDTKIICSSEDYSDVVKEIINEVDGSITEEKVARFKEGTHLGELYSTIVAEERVRHENWESEKTRARSKSGDVVMDTSINNDDYIPLVSLAPEFVRYAQPLDKSNSEKALFAHEAAFDAWMTGYIFLHFHAQKSLIDFARNPLCNRINIYKSLYTINLIGEDQLVDQSKIFLYVKDFDSDWNNESVRLFFDDIQSFNRDKMMQIKWIDGKQLFVEFDPEFKEKIDQWFISVYTIKKLELCPNITVLTWNEFAIEQHAIYIANKENEALERQRNNNTNGSENNRKGRLSMRRK